MIEKRNIRPLILGCLPNFPFIEDTFDALTQYKLINEMGAKINEIIKFCNDTFDGKLDEYFEEKFNDIMINTMYVPETETLVLYLDDGGES